MADRSLPGGEAAARALRNGTTVFVWLAVLTVVEYVIAVADIPFKFGLLTLAAVAKGWLIVQYFMHIGQLRRNGHS